MRGSKRLMAILMALLLMTASVFTGFAETEETPDNTDAPSAEAGFAPEETAAAGSHGEVDQSLALEGEENGTTSQSYDINEIIGEQGALVDGSDTSETLDTTEDDPLLTYPEASALPAEELPEEGSEAQPSGPVDVNTVQFSALTDASLGFTFNYPSDWVNVPGVRTVCFHEAVEEGDYPARIAISVKKMVHSVDSNAMLTELTKFMRIISRQYASSTFQTGKINKRDSFMGRNAYSNTYLAYYGDIEIKGFIIGCAVGKTIVVGHFCATYADYEAMNSVMKYMLNSAQLLSQ